MYKTFLKRIVIMVTTMMAVVATVNFTVDPGNIYLNKVLADKVADSFSSKLLTSVNGLIQKGWNERLVKTMLARSAGDFDCVVLGSSHILQVSSIRNTGNIQQQCDSLLNLGVSGGSFEDLLVFSNIILKQLNLPDRVYVAIDPWTLKLHMDARFGAYESDFREMITKLGSKEMEGSSYFSKLFTNLFSGEYFYQSLIAMFDNDQSNVKKEASKGSFAYPDKFNYDEGYKYAVTLPDGSHVYAYDWILDQKRKNMNANVGGGNYKISGTIYDPAVLDLLDKLIKTYQVNGIVFSLIMTPYHPNVFAVDASRPIEHMKAVDMVVREVAERNISRVYGSFFPDRLGCKKEEFYDFMHASRKCLDRIDFSK